MATDDATASIDEPKLIELSPAECLGLLATNDLGRIAIIDAHGPAVFPVSYELRAIDRVPVIAIRTRPGGVIDRPGDAVCFEIDGLDVGHDGGWNVLVRGVLEPIEPDSELGPSPLLPADRVAWRAIIPTAIAGRRLLARHLRWTFDPHGYL
jgi:Pyridoxamine 5'-phosphate oxidase